MRTENTNTASSVLVFGDDTRSFLSVVRSLGKRGVKVDVCPFDWNSPGLASRYVRNRIQLPPYDLGPDNWLQALQGVLQSTRYDLLIPCDDRSILPLHKHRAAFPQTPVALPNSEALDLFFDKAATRTLAQEAQVPVAPGALLSEFGSAEAIVEQLGLPVVVKPCSSYEIGNLGRRGKVRIVHSFEELQRELALESEPTKCLIEKVVPGHGLGVAALARNGELVSALEYHRVREPEGGGGSTYRVSRPMQPLLLRHVKALADASALDGVAMFEFRFDPTTRDVHLLEVNARFWGGLPLAIFAGMDFPWQLYSQSLEARRAEAVPVSSAHQSNTHYRANVFARNLTSDSNVIVESVLSNLKSNPVKAIRFLATEGFNAAQRILTGRETIDTFSWMDLKPFAAEAKSIARYYAQAITRRLPKLRAWQARAERKTIMRAVTNVKNRPLRVLFACYGNICRSPFAEHYARQLAGIRVEASSTGVHMPVDRRSPQDACEAARTWHVDLNQHRSCHISSTADVDLILVFDHANADAVRASGYHSGTPVARLGALLDSDRSEHEIADPYGRGIEQFNRAYENIARAINRLLQTTEPPSTTASTSAHEATGSNPADTSKASTSQDASIAVVIPTRNRPAMCAEALESVLGQAEAPEQIIVVVDGANDDDLLAYQTLEQSHQGSGLSFIFLAKRDAGHGPSFVRNEGVHAANTSYIAFLDDDDLWTDPQYLARARAAIRSSASPLDALFCRQVAAFPDGREGHNLWLAQLATRLRSQMQPDLFGSFPVGAEELLSTNQFCHLNTTIVRKGLFDAIGGFDEALRYEEDRDLFVRIAERGNAMRLFDLSTARHHVPAQKQDWVSASKIETGRKRLLQLNALNKQILFANKLELRNRAVKQKAAVLQSLSHMARKEGDFRQAALLAREALATYFSLKWLLAATWLSIRAQLERVR